MNSEEDSFIMGVFYKLMCPSKWVLFQIVNTHLGRKKYKSPPPSPASIAPPPTPQCPALGTYTNYTSSEIVY